MKRSAAVLAAAFSCVLVSGPALAADDVAARFGAREAIQQISLSPDGTRVAFIAPVGRGSVLMIGDLVKGGDPKRLIAASGKDDKLSDCHWSTNAALICKIYMYEAGPSGDRLTFSRLVTVDSNSGAVKLLSVDGSSRALDIMQNGGEIIDWVPDGAEGTALLTRQYVPERTIGTNIASTRDGLGVEQVNIATLSRKGVEPPRADAVEYITDGLGKVRIMGMRPRTASGYDGKTIKYFYRVPDKKDWEPLGNLVIDAGTTTGFNPWAVDRKLNVAYGFDNHQGRTALFSVALDATLKRDLVAARDDVDGLVRIGRQNRVVGVSYVTDRRQTEFFDPALRKLGVALAKALPGQPLISFVDANSDESKLLLFAGGDTNPGAYYVYDKVTRGLAEVMPVRPLLAQTALASVKAITFAAADGTQIPAYLTLPPGSDGKNLPSIVMPHGGPGARDEWGFDWLAQYFAARGFAVLQPNFRGSAGYGEAWFNKNGFQSWRTAVGDVNDGGRWLTSQGIAAPGKLAIVGWSYGGYAALQSSVLDAALFKAIVAIAPVTDLETLRAESQGFTNFTMVDAFIGHGAHVVQGSPARNASRIKAPVLMFHGDQDRNVGIGQSRLMARQMKEAGGQAELVEFKGLDHQLDDGEARAMMLDKANTFLRQSLGL
ncbi:alpha/beta hydrolase family protein [Sphingomonas sp. ERG5]|uniref:alpha/beta hydrolase family protein n=1 Tax=Sphingomonas sp. ERG5 TaxID=1381597 RepID=UPI0006917751|nr:S9 family peptidase [Sphingomonas sp. ERG5]